MKGHCPICKRHDYAERTLKEHLLICHRERPVLATAILDLLDLIANLRAAPVGPGAHDSGSCVLCLNEVVRSRK